MDTVKGASGIERIRSERAKASDGDGDGNIDRPPTRRELNRLATVVADLARQVMRNRTDIDMQFQRLAELQAVIDRMQMGAKKRRAKPDGRGE